MAKGTYVTGRLHRISGQIAEASAAKRGGPGAQPDENVEALQQGAPSPEAVQPKAAPVRSPEFEEALLKRNEEYSRLKRDVASRLSAHLAAIPPEAEAISKRYEELSSALERLQELMSGLEALSEPNPDDPDYSARLAEACRSVENARLEMIRITARVEKASAVSAGLKGGSGVQARDSIIPELNSLSFGQLLKFGLFLTLPIAVAIIAGGLVIAFSIYAAMRFGG